MGWLWSLVIRLLLNGVAVFLVAQYVEGITIENWRTAFVTAIVLGLVNTFVKPIVTLITLPITILTVGLFLLILNTAMFALTAALIEGFQIDGFVPAFVGAVILSLVSWVLQWFGK